MTTSQRAMAGVQEANSGISGVAERDQPISEQFRLVAKKWVDEDAAASLLEELKTTTLERMKTDIIEKTPGTADNAATRLAKISGAWELYIVEMVGARKKANRLKVQMKYLEIKHREWIGRDATARAEMKL